MARGIGIFVALIIILGLAGWALKNTAKDESQLSSIDVEQSVDLSAFPSWVPEAFKTDFTKHSVDFSEFLGGGPTKDGIPALTNPEFEPIANSEIDDSVRGLLIEINGERKFYPYNILVWHEIANDEVGGQKVAVTFCPLCGSAVVFNPNVEGSDLEFRVSGLLRESNMVMFDTDTESFWSQSLGEGLVGEHTSKKLEILPFQLLTKREVATKHPGTQIMTTNTGHSRNYQSNPYGDYDENDETYFPVSVDDSRFPAKELFYIVPRDGSAVAIRIGKLADNTQSSSDEFGLRVEKIDGEVFVYEADNLTPGYYEMWFSFATQHEGGGRVWSSF